MMLKDPYNDDTHKNCVPDDSLVVQFVSTTPLFEDDRPDQFTLKTRYKGDFDTTLNGTAADIYKFIKRKRSVSIRAISDMLMDKYEVCDRDNITKDVFLCVNCLWHLALVKWVNGVPFQEIVESDDDGKIMRATHDVVDKIMSLSKGKDVIKYINPTIERMNRIILTTWILGHIPIYVEYREGEMTQAFAVAGKVTCGVMFGFMREDSKHSLIGQIYRRDPSIRILMAQDLYDSKHESALKKFGLRYAGILKKEFEAGDAVIYVE